MMSDGQGGESREREMTVGRSHTRESDEIKGGEKNQRRRKNENGFSVPTYYFSDFFVLAGFEKTKTLLGPPRPPQH